MGHILESYIMFSTLEMHMSSIGKIFIIECFQNFTFFTEGSYEYVMNDHVLLNISTITGKWFRKFVLNLNLTGVLVIICKSDSASLLSDILVRLFKLLSRYVGLGLMKDVSIKEMRTFRDYVFFIPAAKIEARRRNQNTQKSFISALDQSCRYSNGYIVMSPPKGRGAYCFWCGSCWR